MRKRHTIVVSIFLFALLAFTGNSFSQNTTFIGGNQVGYAIGDSCTGTGQLKYDDGTFENGGGWATTVTEGRMVMKFTPPSYPWKFTKFCIGLTRLAAGADSLQYSVIVYDTTGAGGLPGALVATISNQVAKPIGIYAAFAWFSTDVSTVPNLTSGSYYFGFSYNAQLTQNASKFCMMDQSTTTPLRPGYYWNNLAPTWTTAQTAWSGYRAFAMRTIGQSAAGGGCPSRYSSQWCPAGTYANIPSATLYNACAWLGDTLFMHAPDGTGLATTTILRYSIASNTWTTGVPLPVVKTQGTLTNCGGKLYYIGGGAAPGDAGSNSIYEYSAGAWTLKTPLPAALNGHGVVNWGDSVLITVGGPWGTPSTTCYFFRPASNTVGTTSSFGGSARRSHAFGIAGNKIFVACGYPFTNDLWIGTIGANATTITWAAGPVPPGVPRSRVGGAGLCDKFYLVGGNNSVGATSNDTCYVFNINGNNWTVIGGKPAPVHNNEAAVTVKIVGDTAKVFCPGGSSLAATTLNTDVVGCGPTVVGINPNTEIPSYYSLAQNYPNPFNPSTSIKFTTPKAGDVKLVVFDLLGREVATLVNGNVEAGTHFVTFDASQIASGVYFYRIESGSFTDVKKMLLIK